MIVSRNAAKAYMRLHRKRSRNKLCGFEAATLDSKLARTYADDLDIYHGLNTWRTRRDRPGQRDDESRCAHGKMVPVY